MVKNNMLKREEITQVIACEATPSRKTLQEKIAAKQGSKPELTVIKNIKTQFGQKKVEVVAYIYDDMKSLLAAEPTHRKIKMGLEVKAE
jgi:small subunit ribosomal protein S24e